MDEMIERFKELYPDKMVLDNMDEYSRIKLAGKVELLNEIAEFIEEEYSGKLNVTN